MDTLDPNTDYTVVAGIIFFSVILVVGCIILCISGCIICNNKRKSIIHPINNDPKHKVPKIEPI